MKKSANADIQNLFRKFGGDTGNYQEIQRDYVIEKAQKTWPIVTAIENERINAPVLKASANKPATRAAVAGSSAAQSGLHLAGLREPVSEHDASGVKSVSSMFDKQAPVSSARPSDAGQSSLFGSLRSAAKPAASSVFGFLSGSAKTTPSVEHAPFASLHLAAKPVSSPTVSPAGVQVALIKTPPPDASSAGEKQIASIFSRLQKSQSVSAAQDTSLRSLFGFLKKQ